MNFIFVAFLATLIWMITGIIIYLYPPFKRISQLAEKEPSVKKWSNPRHYLVAEFIYIFIQCFLFAYVFSIIKVSLPADLFMQAVSFALIIIAIKVIPRTLKMLIHTTYPGKLLFIEFIYSVFASFGVSMLFVLLI
ncbi:MAG: hypothetical protein N3E50_10000 [Candidatus Goldbacteria bacterium]|nr:hypothetical protein [Candidatus Goldiibacteriota bacterium]